MKRLVSIIIGICIFIGSISICYADRTRLTTNGSYRISMIQQRTALHIQGGYYDRCISI